jgi:hypothetical protein
MRRNRKGRAVLCALGLGAVLATADVARALTLADLDGGGSFSVAGLTFANFAATVTGDISLDLADYPVQLLADGFRLSGPLSVLLGDAGTLLLSYQVTATDPILVGASLFAAGTTIGAGAQAWVGESLLGPANEVLGSLFSYDIEGVGSVPSDFVAFGAVPQISVAKTVSLGSGLFAAIPVIDQRFQFIPEPVAMWLLTLGLVGLAWWRPRRRLVD